MAYPSAANPPRNNSNTTLKVLMVFLRWSQSTKILGSGCTNVHYVSHFFGVIQRGLLFTFYNEPWPAEPVFSHNWPGPGIPSPLPGHRGANSRHSRYSTAVVYARWSAPAHWGNRVCTASITQKHSVKTKKVNRGPNAFLVIGLFTFQTGF